MHSPCYQKLKSQKCPLKIAAKEKLCNFLFLLILLKKNYLVMEHNLKLFLAKIIKQKLSCNGT